MLLGPIDKQCLTTGGREFGAHFWRQVELFGQSVNNIAKAWFSTCRPAPRLSLR